MAHEVGMEREAVWERRVGFLQLLAAGAFLWRERGVFTFVHLVF